MLTVDFFHSAYSYRLTGSGFKAGLSRVSNNQPGDRLTSSSLAGHAMKADDDMRSIGSVVGKVPAGGRCRDGYPELEDPDAVEHPGTGCIRHCVPQYRPRLWDRWSDVGTAGIQGRRDRTPRTGAARALRVGAP